MQFTPEESSRFQKSFEDPEFRKLFADYMDELSDPKNREETEAYISQLEGEQKVPEGKELIRWVHYSIRIEETTLILYNCISPLPPFTNRPEPVFVAKSYKEFKKDKKDKEKVFLNIVQSGKINTPSKTDTPKGTCWSVPYSLGPPHMEKDKNGDNAPCFDCCFHPEAIRLGMQHKEFKDLLVTTAMEGVEKLYQQQGQDVSISDFRFSLLKKFIWFNCLTLYCISSGDHCQGVSRGERHQLQAGPGADHDDCGRQQRKLERQE